MASTGAVLSWAGSARTAAHLARLALCVCHELHALPQLLRLSLQAARLDLAPLHLRGLLSLSLQGRCGVNKRMVDTYIKRLPEEWLLGNWHVSSLARRCLIGQATAWVMGRMRA